MNITENDIERVLQHPNNSFLTNKAVTKYDKFKNIDPFPDISNSLLNGNDVAKYILATGLLDPFYPDRLHGVTYTANFSGKLYFWTTEGKQIFRSLNDEEEYEIQPNSITYLEIDTLFYVPNYIALRFNLRVKNVYKGLLLGTGPIIDSGFVGKIFIPLYNLTTNSYIIRKNTKLIEIEFTKLSINEETHISDKLKLETGLDKWNFDDIPRIINDIPKSREFNDYLYSALTDKNSGFYLKGDQVLISSANSELKKEINESCSSIDKELDNLKEQEKNINITFEKVEHRENFIKCFSILSIIAMLLTAISLGITASSYFSQSTELELANQNVQQLIEYNEQRIQDILLIINNLETSTEIPEELRVKYNDMLQEIRAEINKLEEQRDKQGKSYVSIIILFIFITIFLLFTIWYTYFILNSSINRKIKNLGCEKKDEQK